jgi:hypothetical protein
MTGLGIGLGIGDAQGNGYSPLSETGAVAWYDASDISTLFKDTGLATPVTANGDTCKGWKNKTGGTAATGVNGCIYQSAGRAGRGTLKFSKASSHSLQALFTLAQPAHIFAVVQEHTAASVGNETMFDGGATGNTLRIFDQAAGTFTMFAGSSLTIFANTAGWMRMEALYSGAASHASRDGAAAITGNPGTGTPGGITIGSFQNGTGPGDYEYGEIAVFNAAQDVECDGAAAGLL